MAMVKLTVRVRDAENRVLIRDTQEVQLSKVAESAQQMAATIARQFSKATSGRRTDD